MSTGLADLFDFAVGWAVDGNNNNETIEMSHHDGHHGHHMAQGDATTIASTVDHSGHLMSGTTHAQGMHSGMAMYFHFGFENFVLFEQWTAQSVTSLLITCVIFFVLAILYEILKAYRRVVALRFQISQTARIVHASGSGAGTIHHHTAHVEGQTDGVSAGSSISTGSNNGHQKLVPESGTSNSLYVMDPNVPLPDDPSIQVITPGQHSSYGIQSTSSQQVRAVATSGSIPLFSSRHEMCSLAHLLSTLLYMLQVALAYLLMLAFMLFNVWICLAILVGAAAGHFLLANKAIALQDHTQEDYCH